MAWLPMYLLQTDVELINDWLNQEEDIAFLVSNGGKKWIAKKQHDVISDIGTQLIGNVETAYFNYSITPEDLEKMKKTTMPNFAEYYLWHIPSGPLPCLNQNPTKIKFTKQDHNDEAVIADPWAGWIEQRTGANSRIPYFGPGHPGVIHLEIKLPASDIIPMSYFGWIGNHYKIIGSGADKSTEKFWNKLRRMTKKVATHIPISNNLNRKKEAYAFPAAYEEILKGRPCQ